MVILVFLHARLNFILTMYSEMFILASLSPSESSKIHRDEPAANS